MAEIFTITDDIKEIARKAIDDMINQMGKDYKLIYPPKFEACNCNSPNNPGSKPLGYARHGGPVPMANASACPYCGGTNKRQTEVSETVRFLSTWEPKEFITIFQRISVSTPDSYLQIKGYITDVPKVLNAVELVGPVNVEGYMRSRFERVSKPIDVSNIVQGRYFVCLYKQVG